MRERILVPVDGSKSAHHALAYACAFARATLSELTLLHVVSSAPEIMSLPWSTSHAATFRRHQDQRLSLIRGYLQASAEELQAACVLAHTEVVEGDPASAIVSWVKKDPTISMVVMSASGGGAGIGGVNGSVGHKVMRECPVPLMLVRSQEGGPPAAHLFRNILVPLDGSLAAEQALGHAQRLAGITGATLQLLSVLPSLYLRFGAATFLPVRLDSVEVNQNALDADLYEVQRYLWPVAATLAASGLRVKSTVVRGEAAEEILRQAAASGADLIVMSMRRKTGLLRLLPGVASKVVREGKLPVLLIPVGAG
ncbi:MAG TPA: universal stress protein [Chloroflexia bacterium]|jgi:nucleotide-binding universal stress UspA family protein